MGRIDDYVRKLVGVGASDLLLGSERQPLYRAANELLPLPGEGVLSDEDLCNMVADLIGPDDWQTLQEDHQVTCLLALTGDLRAAAMCHLAQHGLTVRLRLLGSLELGQIDLALPAAAESLLAAEAGLLVVTGPAGSGKTTWIARFLSRIAAQRTVHIATCEDPVEYLLEGAEAPISQRALGLHSRSIAGAIDGALACNAGVIACSDLQAPGVFERMVEAATSGVLAVGELRGHGAVNALEQLLASAPAMARPQLACDLADSLLASISLDLLPKKNGGRVIAIEVLSATQNVTSLLRDGKTHMLPALLDREPGMQSMDRCLLDLASRAVVEGREAHARAADKRLFTAWV